MAAALHVDPHEAIATFKCVLVYLLGRARKRDLLNPALRKGSIPVAFERFHPLARHDSPQIPAAAEHVVAHLLQLRRHDEFFQAAVRETVIAHLSQSALIPGCDPPQTSAALEGAIPHYRDAARNGELLEPAPAEAPFSDVLCSFRKGDVSEPGQERNALSPIFSSPLSPRNATRSSRPQL